MKTLSVKVSADTLKQIAEIEKAFSLVLENRSQVVRFCVAMVHSMTFMTPTVVNLLWKVQGLIRQIPSHGQMDFDWEK